MINTDITIIYHGNCIDGEASRWLLKKGLKELWRKVGVNVKFTELPYFHTEKFNKELIPNSFAIYFVDVCPREVVEYVFETHSSSAIYIIDHHEEVFKYSNTYSRMAVVYSDRNRSAVGLVKYVIRADLLKMDFWFLKYIQDRDLWKWSLPYSREINEYIFSNPPTDEWFEELALTNTEKAIEIGTVLLRKVDKEVSKLLNNIVEIPLGEITLKAINTPLHMSEVCEALYKKYDSKDAFGTFFILPSGNAKFSIRSRTPDGVDCNVLAGKFGGGGHKHAAGFTLPNLLSKGNS